MTVRLRGWNGMLVEVDAPDGARTGLRNRGGAPVALSDRSLLSIALVVGLVAAMSLSACGRRGPLEAPPSAAAIAGDPVDENGEPVPPKPDKPFIGDFLLDG